MGWDEKLFGIIYGALRRKAGLAAHPGAALLEPARARLTLFGTAVARRKIEIGVAENEGRRSGTTLLLPSALTLAANAHDNERAYVLRVALDATSLRLGLSPVRPLAGAGPAVFARLALPITLAALDDDLPGVRVLFDELRSRVIASRPPLAKLPPRALVVEVLTRSRLGVAWRKREEETSRDIVERARRAGATDVFDAASLTRTADELSAGVRVSDLVPVVLWGAIDHDPREALRSAAFDAQTPDATGTERTGKTREGVRRLTLDDAALEDNPLTHVFEKVQTIEEHTGGSKAVDGSDELTAHGEALDEIAMREVVRSRERAHSIYKADVSFDGDVTGGEVGDPDAVGGIAYDEWDERAGTYRKDHCRVFVSQAGRPADLSRALGAVREVVRKNARHVHDVESRFERIERARRERGRQADGTDIDTDAMVERYGALIAGHTGEDRLYVARRPHVRDLAVLILLDASLSSDAWVDGRRVLDVAKEAVVVVGEALARLSVQAGVAAFFSNTRRDCRFVIVKSFDADWQTETARLATVTPTAYTRIGPALRHGARMLEETGARRKLLLMIGDGKPTDFDRYEGRYGIGDVRRAVSEAERRGIHTFALAIDRAARAELPRMFGPNGFYVLARPSDLSDALGRVCADLAR
ncbi:nitric oxide reductase activation protein NorD [soil metagenome]